MGTRFTGRRRLAVLVAGAAATVGTLGACASDDTSGATTSPTSSTSAPPAAPDTTSDAPHATGGDAGSTAPGDDTPAPPADATTAPPTTIHDVTTAPREINEPVELDAPADFGTGVRARVLDLVAVDGEARAPGEIAGPALRVEYELVNDGADPVDLSGAFVDLSYGPERTPASPLGQPGAIPLPSELAPGERAVAAAVFLVPLDQRDDLQIALAYSTAAPVVVFTGGA